MKSCMEIENELLTNGVPISELDIEISRLEAEISNYMCQEALGIEKSCS